MRFDEFVVKIYDQNNKNFLGTGFFIESSLLISCAHVLEARRQVSIKSERSNDFFLAEIKKTISVHDLVILSSEHTPSEVLDNVHPLVISADVDLTSVNLRAYGYPTECRGEPQRLEYSGIAKDAEVGDLLTFQNASGIRRGYSGAPVITCNGCLVGIIIDYPATGGTDKAFAVPAEVLRNDFPELFHKTRAINRNQPFKFNSDTTFFSGRDEEISALREFLEKPSHYSVLWWAIMGAGGSGKSRLAYELCLQVEPDWRVHIIHRNHPLSYQYFEGVYLHDKRDVLLIIDTAISDLSCVAKWISARNEENSTRKVRVLFLRREILNAHEDPLWVRSIIDTDMHMADYLYNESFVHLDVLQRGSVQTIIESYISIMKPDFKIELDDINLLITSLDSFDSLHRPLLAMFIADAYINGEDPFSWGEEKLLEYTYKRERNIIWDKIEQAFNIKYQDNSDFYKEIELAYTSATIQGKSQVSNAAFKLIGMEKKQFLSRLENYGITQESNVTSIEPDIVGEYFVLRNFMELRMIPTNEDFYVRFFRDLYMLLNVKYENVLREMLFVVGQNSMGIIPVAYAQGLYELTINPDIKLSTAVNAMNCLLRVVPTDKAMGICDFRMAEYLAKGLVNISLRQSFEQANVTLEIIHRLYRSNLVFSNGRNGYFLAEPFARGLMILNEGRWFKEFLNDLKEIYESHSERNEAVKELIHDYVDYLLDVETTYKRDEILGIVSG